MQKRLREIENALSSKRAGGVPSTEAEGRRRKELALAELHEMKVLERRRELVSIGAINAWVAGMIIAARDILLQIGPELADKLAQQSDPIRCREMIDKEIRRALGRLAQYKPPDGAGGGGRAS